MGSQNSENSGSMNSEDFGNFWGPQVFPPEPFIPQSLVLRMDGGPSLDSSLDSSTAKVSSVKISSTQSDAAAALNSCCLAGFKCFIY